MGRSQALSLALVVSNMNQLTKIQAQAESSLFEITFFVLQPLILETSVPPFPI